jgi:DNA-binding beta-propeller fold protein YncE
VLVRRLVLALIPLALFAQVEVDTIVRLPAGLSGGGYYIPEFNKLYVMGRSDIFVVDCSTYSLKAKIPLGFAGGTTCYSWSPRRQKLYVVANPSIDSTLVIDVATDSVIDTLGVPREWYNDVYVSDIDVRFKPAVDTLFEYECANDEIKRRLPIHSTCASWDSVGRKLYVGQGSWKRLYVYDYLLDSCLKVIDVSAVTATTPDALVFSRTYRRGYLSSYQFEPLGPDNLGIVDTERDTLLRVLPVRIREGLYRQVAVNERDGKVYVTDSDGSYSSPDTMWVVDCATDSVLKKFECVRRGKTNTCIRWVPWSNRVYLVNTGPEVGIASTLVVIDCNTDSVIVPEMLTSHGFIRDIQLDPIRERIFVVGVDSTDVYVLRDVHDGVAEEPSSTSLASTSGLNVQTTADGYDLSYSIPVTCRVDLSVYDLAGREVRRLVAAEQPAGAHRVLWNCRDTAGDSVPRGVYLVRLDTPDFTDVKKAVVTR